MPKIIGKKFCFCQLSEGLYATPSDVLKFQPQISSQGKGLVKLDKSSKFGKYTICAYH